MSRKRKGFAKIGLIILIVVIAVGYGFRLRTRRLEQAAAVLPAGREVVVTRGDLARSVSSTGTIAAAQDLELAFDVGDKVKEVLVQATERVAKGAVLARLADTEQQKAYITAKRDLELAKFEAAPSVIKEKELQLEIAQANLQNTTLKAPFSGIVARVDIQPEEWVTSGTPVMRLLDTSRMFLNVGVDEVDIRYVEVGQKAIVTLDAYPELKLSGTVVEVGIVPEAGGQVVIFPVKIELDDPDPRVRVGMSAEAEIVVEKAENVLLVPFEAVTSREGKDVVAKVTEEGIELTEVETGLSDGFLIEIKAGLQEGDRILASNYELYRTLQGGMGSGSRAIGGVRISPPGGMRR
ncbi:MAG: efflux RND transporter periplasmic adaptor subunit [Firmicutes bacterium]|nr:efflux RND transporter periplasmic adaptor subunit [Bacillota bacterium]